MNKLFIIGLPRTGTTSVSAALLPHQLKVAHTALTKQAFALADVISDTPCFADYRQLDQLFPGSKFVYLDRDLNSWLPSIQMLLGKIMHRLEQNLHLNPVIKRCFEDIFGTLSGSKFPDDKSLKYCYYQHQCQVNGYFAKRNDLLKINIGHSDSLHQLLDFIGKQAPPNQQFPHLNSGTMVTAWRDIKHPNKVNSNAIGPDRRKFLEYK